jgi:arylsulfatase A-like enzyme
MDSLCRSGVRLESACCTNPICSPSRSSLFTGRMPSETGVNRLHPSASIRPEIPTIGQWLGKAGYDSVYTGKWHVPACHSYEIPGFRVLGSGQDHRGDVSDVTVSHAAEAFLRQRRSREPFLLVASLTQPHDICDWLRLNQRHKRVPPYPLPRRAFPALPPLPPNFGAHPSEPVYVRRYREEKCEPNLGGWDRVEWRWCLWNYYRMVEMADAELGRILAALAASGKAENTVVVFTSDHGEGMGEHRLDRKNFHYDSAVRVPLVFSWPGRLPANQVNRRALASGIDLVPTLCGFAGVEPPPMTTAVDLGPVLTGRAREARPFLGVELSVRAVGRVLRTPRYKYAVFAGDPVEQLFDLQADPGETRNLAARHQFRDVLQTHREHLAAWEQRLCPVADAPGAGIFSLPVR